MPQDAERSKPFGRCLLPHNLFTLETRAPTSAFWLLGPSGPAIGLGVLMGKRANAAGAPAGAKATKLEHLSPWAKRMREAVEPFG